MHQDTDLRSNVYATEFLPKDKVRYNLVAMSAASWHGQEGVWGPEARAKGRRQAQGK
jgi:hypothetical protein